MANLANREALAAKVAQQVREIQEYRRDHVDLRPAEWDQICEALRARY